METKDLRSAHVLIQATREYLYKLRYTKLSMGLPERTWRHLEEYLQIKGIIDFTQETGMQFLEHRYHYSSNPDLETNKDRLRAIQLLVDYQRSEHISIRKENNPRRIAEPFRRAFLEFMESHQKSGITRSTLDAYEIYLKRFSEYLVDQNVATVNEIDNFHIHGFIQATAAVHRISTVYCTSCVLRVFFRYLFEKEMHPKNLVLLVPRVNISKKSRVPSAYSQEDIQMILAATDRGSPKGKRDYAMLLIAVRLGLRASDICRLTLDNFKWESNTIELQQEKTKELLILPLLNDIGEAVIDHLKYGRPVVQDKEIFLRLSAPIGPLSAPTLHSIVTQYMSKAGVLIPEGKKHGPHALRHSLASALLHNNTPMPVISEILGHTDTETTSIYLKIDILHLRNYALDVPPVRVVVLGGVVI